MDSILKSWKTLEWDSLQTRLEEEIRAITIRQDGGDEVKKVLLDESNSYRASTTKETRKVAVPLIKAFQKEVDRLTTSGKATEASLIDICSRLMEIPDPSAILEQVPVWKTQAEKANNAIEEANQLRTSIAELHDEFSDLKNQDVTIRQLRERIKQLEGEKTIEVEQSVDETERKLRDEFAAREFEMNMRAEKQTAEKITMEKKVSELEVRLRDAQRRMDSARLAADQRESLESEQIDILSRDLEDANRRVSSLEMEVSRLTADLAESQASSKRGGLEDIAAFGGLMKEKDEQMARIQNENKRLSEALEAEARKAKADHADLVRKLEAQTKIIRDMEVKMAEQQDYEAVKNELRLLREIEFGEAATANEESISRLGETVQSLDRLLAEKNRRLQNENAQLRMNGDRQKGSTGDDVMKAILAGSHQMVVDSVSKKVGKEIARNYMDPEVDFALDRQINRSKRAVSRERERRQQQPVVTNTPSADNDHQNLFQILLNMGSPMQDINGDSGSSSKKELDRSPTDIPFDQFRYSPKLTNYTGEPSKTPQEIKAIQDLQNRVLMNIRNLGTRALNTAEISKQCKRLMMSYNIGQRLFAKYVMNQSQGSLSELLSKPRHWSKLTDKGREAFRRIYGWISDEKSIDILCSLSPRRIWPNDCDPKIDHPTPESLWESNSGKLPQEDPDESKIPKKSANSAREDQYRLAGTTHAANSGSTQRNSRWRHDDIPKEKIMSIFQNEMAKLREQETSLERAMASRSFGTGHMEDLNSPYHEMSQSERMASINHAHQVMNTRMRVGLAPITQDQFEMFGHIDTEDVVRQIKEFLSMNSISQRQFGEHVLGLSQGSVSDLLARPKQWSLLTQKGREPFIRMKLFMKEVAQTTARARREAAAGGGEGSRERDHRSPSSDEMNNEEPGHFELPPLSATITSVPLPFEGINIKQEIEDEDFPKSEIDRQLDEQIQRAQAAEDEVDTVALVRRVKDRLHLNGISQRFFGEHVLLISSGGCSELFHRPRPWNTLSARGKEPYERMRDWLQESDGVARLLALERVEGELPTGRVNENGKRLSSDPPFEPPPRKVQRTVITDQQKEALRFVFQHEHHPSQKTVELLSMKLNLNIRTVNNWFHNHRTRQKASLKEGKVYSSAVPSGPKSKNWQQDLAQMLEKVQRANLLEDSLPTMVPLKTLFRDDSIDSGMSSDIGGPNDSRMVVSSSQLDKAVAKMLKLAASKSS